MKIKIGLALMMASISFLYGCQTTGSEPSIQSVQPTQQEENQSRLNDALKF